MMYYSDEDIKRRLPAVLSESGMKTVIDECRKRDRCLECPYRLKKGVFCIFNLCPTEWEDSEAQELRVYISGAITGRDKKDYMTQFADAEKKLSAIGYEVINPAKVNALMPDTFTHDEYMETSLAMLRCCNVLYQLKGWRDSKGAHMEWEYAQKHDYMILEEL